MDKTKKIVVMSGKGGVGKTTVAGAIALILSTEEEKTVGALDVDIHGPNLPVILGLREARMIAQKQGDKEEIYPVELKSNLKLASMGFLLPAEEAPVIWRGPLKAQMVKSFIHDIKWGELDYLVADLPPGTGDEALSIVQELGGVDIAVIVTTPQEVSLVDARKAIMFAKKMDIPRVGIVENMSGLICPHCKKEIEIFKSGGGRKTAEQMRVAFLGSVPFDPSIVHAGDEGKHIVLEEKEKPAVEALYRVVDRIKEVMG